MFPSNNPGGGFIFGGRTRPREEAVPESRSVRRRIAPTTYLQTLPPELRMNIQTLARAQGPQSFLDRAPPEIHELIKSHYLPMERARLEKKIEDDFLFRDPEDREGFDQFMADKERQLFLGGLAEEIERPWEYKDADDYWSNQG